MHSEVFKGMFDLEEDANEGSSKPTVLLDDETEFGLFCDAILS